MKLLLRKIRKHPFYFLTGQFSLVLGMATCLIIYSFIAFHQSFDNFEDDTERIYRILSVDEKDRTIALTTGTLKANITANFPETAITHFMQTPVDLTFEYEDRSITADQGLLVDAEFQEVLSPKLLHGNEKQLLQQPNSIVLSETLASSLFGNAQFGLGETLQVQIGPKKVSLKVTGIASDSPANTGLPFQYLLTGSSSIFWNDEAPYTIFHTFLKSDATTQDAVTEQLNLPAEKNFNFQSQLLSDIHLSSGIEYDIFQKFDRQYLHLLTAIGLLIFSITFFNFLNLFYTQSIKRIREITTRKVLGSSRLSVFRHLLGDLGFSLLFALVAAMGVILFTSRPLSDFLGFSLLHFYDIPSLVVTLSGALLAGALFVYLISQQLLSQNTQTGLRGKIVAGNARFNISKWLLAAQLVVTLFSVSCGLVISGQTQLLKNADVGYSWQNILTLKRPDDVAFSTWQSLQQQLEQQTAVQSIGMAVFPGIGEYNQMSIKNQATQEKHLLYWIGVDAGYLPTMEISLLSGRNFDKDNPTDQQAMIINEKALALLGSEGLSEQVYQFRKKGYRIIGVVRDFNHQSLKEASQPMMMTLNNPNAFRHMSIRYEGLSRTGMSELVNEASTSLGIQSGLNMKFLEDDYNEKLMAEENVIALVSKIFSAIAILISLLGLVSYFSFVVSQQKKDFSIRKVFGAGLIDILGKMLAPQLLTASIALLIATPIAIYSFNEWKNQFLYQLQWDAFYLLAPPLFVIALIAGVTLAYSILIDRVNPVKHLREEG